MEKVPIRVLVGCPKYFYRQYELEWCYSCDYFGGMEYIENGFKSVICNYNLLVDEEGEKE